jgi:hypothetical protein
MLLLAPRGQAMMFPGVIIIRSPSGDKEEDQERNSGTRFHIFSQLGPITTAALTSSNRRRTLYTLFDGENRLFLEKQHN